MVNLDGFSVVIASTYPVEDVSGLLPGRVILKTLKIVPTALLLGTKHISDRLGGISARDWCPLQGEQCS